MPKTGPVYPPNVTSVQDMPPPGGYPPINFARGMRNRGPPGWAIWLGVLTATVYGFNQAERDRELAAYIEESRKKEAEIMKNRPDWKVGESVYSRRWNPPTLFKSKI
eukprot:gene23660-32032_t